MSKILLPINPIYVNKILMGKKKYEYRKVRPKKSKIDRIIIYSTYPIIKVVGEVQVKEILENNKKSMWEITKNYSGIDKDSYDNIYHKKKNAIAYKLGKITKYKNPISLSDIGINYIPQSFVYID